MNVALHTSAWIETRDSKDGVLALWVALHTSAWIETNYVELTTYHPSVALHTSAWIETPSQENLLPFIVSRAPHERVD